MGELKKSIFYREAIQLVEKPYGKFYLFDTFIVSEINEGVVFTWDGHGKNLSAQFEELYEQNGSNLVYISNRINSYSIKPNDWIKFFKSNYSFKAYGAVNYRKQSLFSLAIEKLFFNKEIQSFATIDDAIIWAKVLTEEKK